MKIKIGIENFINNIKQAKSDYDNRKTFVNEMKNEVLNPNSLFNEFKLNIDDLYMHLSTIIKMPPEMQLNANDAEKLKYLKDASKSVNIYIGTTLNWGEYFKKPEFYYIEDEDDNENMSCTYLAIWEYKPIILDNAGFWCKVGIVSLFLLGFISACVILPIVL